MLLSCIASYDQDTLISVTFNWGMVFSKIMRLPYWDSLIAAASLQFQLSYWDCLFKFACPHKCIFIAVPSLRPPQCGLLSESSSVRDPHWGFLWGTLIEMSWFRRLSWGILIKASSLRLPHWGILINASSLRHPHWGSYWGVLIDVPSLRCHDLGVLIEAFSWR